MAEVEEVNWEDVRSQFPILSQRVNGRPLAYLDNAATTQVPTCVIDAIQDHYATNNGNVHRGTHELSNRSTNAYEKARERIARFINAPSSDCIVFTRGTTDSLNTIATSFARLRGKNFSALTTAMEHHSNFVPWQQMADLTGGQFNVVPLNNDGDLDMEALCRLLDTQLPGIVSVAHVSNVLGTVNPLHEIIQAAHARGWLVSVDAAQSIRHELIDVQDIDCDFLSFSGHKTLGPTGIGVLYGKTSLLNTLPPISYGGEMVDTVRMEQTSFEVAPLRFEAGTPNYVGAIALARAFDYLTELGIDAVRKREHELCMYCEEVVTSVKGVRVLGSPKKRAGVVSFVVEGVHPFDVAVLMDKMGVAIRSGSQCAQPLLEEIFDVGETDRISPAFYNTRAEIEEAGKALEKALSICRA